MRLEVTDSPRETDEAFVIAQVHAYNATFAAKDTRSLCVFAHDDEGSIIGGLTGRTNWQYLEVLFLWVHEEHRNTRHFLHKALHPVDACSSPDSSRHESTQS